MDYSDFILPWLIHPAGHLTYGNQASGNARLDVGNLSEKWRGPIRAYREPTVEDILQSRTMISRDREGMDHLAVPIYDETAQSNFGGAGFEAQDAFGRAKKSPAYNIGNALHKAMYLAGSDRFSGANLGGDIRQMERNSGNKYVEALLAATAADDLRRAFNPDSNVSLDFTTNNGAPGIMASVPIDQYLRPVWSKRDKRK